MTHARVAIALSVALLGAACTSTRALQCSAAGQPHPSRNFGRVLTAQGEPTAIYRGGQPNSCHELQYLRSIGVKSILKLNDRGLPIDDDEEKQAAALGLRMRSFAFSAATIGTASSCAQVAEALLFLKDQNNWPIYVHCTAGKDRTGYMIGLYEKLILGTPTANVLSELHHYGHRGIRSIVMGQIDAELAKDVPVCQAAMGSEPMATSALLLLYRSKPTPNAIIQTGNR